MRQRFPWKKCDRASKREFSKWMWQNIVGLKAAAADVEVPRKEALANSKTFSKMAA